MLPLKDLNIMAIKFISSDGQLRSNILGEAQQRDREHDTTKNNQQQPLVLSVNQFCAAFGICRTSAYKLFNRGDIRTAKAGKRRLVPISEVNRLLAGGTK